MRAKRRYAILVAAVGMQMCLGATYSWSIYVQPLRQAAGLMQGTAQLPFTRFYFAFPATMALAGGFFPRLGPRRCAQLGGLLFGCGWLLVFAVLTGMNYGGVLLIYAASTARIWGAARVGQIYGWLFSANIPAALAPLAAGYTYDYTGRFYPALAGISLMMLLTIVLATRCRELIGDATRSR